MMPWILSFRGRCADFQELRCRLFPPQTGLGQGRNGVGTLCPQPPAQSPVGLQRTRLCNCPFLHQVCDDGNPSQTKQSSLKEVTDPACFSFDSCFSFFPVTRKGSWRPNKNPNRTKVEENRDMKNKRYETEAEEIVERHLHAGGRS